jgi:uncharacterized protein
MTLYIEQPTLISLKAQVHPGLEHAFIDWQAKFNAEFVLQPGFVSLEFLSPSAAHPHWLIVQRLSNSESAASWRRSTLLKRLLADLEAIAVAESVQEVLSSAGSQSEGVTEVIIVQIAPEHDSAFRAWSAKIHQAEATFPGFRGVYVQAPDRAAGNCAAHWITLLQFDTMENLDRWLTSAERQKLLQESAPFISTLETHRMISPYAGWFASIAKVKEMPPAWKQSMLVLLVLFPIVMLELKYLALLTKGLNSSLATFIGNALSVALLAFPMMPIAIYFLGWWLIPAKQKQRQTTLLGFLLLLALYLAEIAFFWT